MSPRLDTTSGFEVEPQIMKTKVTVHLELSKNPDEVRQQLEDFARAVKIFGVVKNIEASVEGAETVQTYKPKQLRGRRLV